MTAIRELLAQPEYQELSDAAAAERLNQPQRRPKRDARVTLGMLLWPQFFGPDRTEQILDALKSAAASGRLPAGARVQIEAALAYLADRGIDLGDPQVREVWLPQVAQLAGLTDDEVQLLSDWAFELGPSPAQAHLGRQATAADVARARRQIEMHRRREAAVFEMRRRIDQIEAAAYHWIEDGDGTGTVEELDAILRGE